MTGGPRPPAEVLRPRASRVWRIAYRILYRLLRLVDPFVRSAVANGAPGLEAVVQLRVPGRHSGRQRRLMITLLAVGEQRYIGHPNGETAWTRNAAAAGVVHIDPPARHGAAFRVVRLPPGAERDAVIGVTRVQQPFPGNLIYRAATRHIAAVGVYFRLEPVTEDA